MGYRESEAFGLQRVPDAIESMRTLDDVKEAIKKLNALEQMLKAMDEFHINAVRFATLEAAMLVKIVNLGYKSQLTGDRKKAAEWLSEMTEEERNDVILQCSAGITITEFYRRTVKKAEKEEKSAELLEMYIDDIAEEYDENGIVSVSSFESRLDSSGLSDEVKAMMRNGLRTKLLRKRALGIGDGKGTYVSRDMARTYAEQIVETRIKSMAADMMSLVRITEEIGITPEINIDCKNNVDHTLNAENAIRLAACIVGAANPEFNTVHKRNSIFAMILHRFGFKKNDLAFGMDRIEENEIVDTVCHQTSAA